MLIVAICVLFLGVKVFFVKGGKFPNEHISESKAMQQHGIHCYTEQDAEFQRVCDHLVAEKREGGKE